MSTQSVVSFVAVDGRARWTNGFLIATLLISAVGIISGYLEIELLSQVMTEGVSEAEAAANDARQGLIGILQVIAYLGTAVAFLTWFHGVHKNLPTLGGRDMKYTPGWAVGGFFVPFLNLVRPFQVMREVWHGSDPSGIERDVGSSGPSIRNQLGAPALVGWWWALFLISGFLGQIIFRMSFSEDQTLGQIEAVSRLMVISDILDLPSAILAISLVSRITRWQAQRAERISLGEIQFPNGSDTTSE